MSKLTFFFFWLKNPCTVLESVSHLIHLQQVLESFRGLVDWLEKQPRDKENSDRSLL